MIHSTPKSSPKIFEIIEVSLWPPSNLAHNPLEYIIWSVLENKIYLIFYPNISSLKTVIEKEWYKMSEEFILKACKSFRSRVETKNKKTKKKKKKKKRWPHWVSLLSRVYLLILFSLKN